MTLISRYVLRELLLVFSTALGALTLFMLFVGLFREAQQQGLGLTQILMLVPYALARRRRGARLTTGASRSSARTAPV